MFEWLYFREVTVHLNFRYCSCFEQEVLKLQSVDSLWNARSSHRWCSVRKGILRNFAKFTGKHLCQSHFFKKETLEQVFPCEFCEICNNALFPEYLLTTASYAYVTIVIYSYSTYYCCKKCNQLLIRKKWNKYFKLRN